MKKIFPSKSTKTLYRREKNLKEILSPSLFPVKPKNSENCITSCKKCDICKNDLLTDNTFKCKVNGRFYKVRGNLSCNSSNVIYLISCKNCEDQYIGSAIDFKARIRNHKSDIKTKKGGCGTARHFNTKCYDVQNPHRYIHTYIYMHTYTLYRYIYIHIYIHVYIYTIYTYICIYIDINIYIHVYYIYMFTYK